MKWKKITPHQYYYMKYIIYIWLLSIATFITCYMLLQNNIFLIGLVAMISIGVLYITTIRPKFCKVKEKADLINDFIKKNSFLQSHKETKQGILREKVVDIFDYYPHVEYSENITDNIFLIRFRLDGSAISQKFKHLEQSLAEMFKTVCTDIIYERGYITYCFELCEQKQVMIETYEDILLAGENEIVFSENLTWNWKKTPHLLLTGPTGSGKTLLAQFIISTLLNQGVRVIYCDPKNDAEMRHFMKNMCVTYVTKENEIAQVIRETEEEIRLREQDLNNIGIEEAEFNPVFVFFDELISFAKIADKRTYDETIKRFGSIVVTGRSKRIYACALLQRCDSEFLGGGAIRDNFACRICMGHMSEKAYEMAFGSEFSHIKNYRCEIGSGLIYRDGVDTKPREFLAPYICKGALNRE